MLQVIAYNTYGLPQGCSSERANKRVIGQVLKMMPNAGLPPPFRVLADIAVVQAKNRTLGFIQIS